MDEQKVKQAFGVLAQQNAILFYNHLRASGVEHEIAREQAAIWIGNVIASLEGVNVFALPDELKAESFDLVDAAIDIFYPNRDKPQN